MAMTWRQLSGRVGYGLVFCVGLPAFLGLWSHRLAQVLPELRPVHAPIVGLITAGIGGVMVLAAMIGLVIRGKGLPMNAFPPSRLVTSGLYALVPHPIYVGFTLVCAGVAMHFGNAPGLWLLTPLVALGAAALVWGYERPDLLKRFATVPRPFLSLPPHGPERPAYRERFGVMLLLFPLWLVLYESMFLLGAAPDAFDARMAAERVWPVLAWTELVYATAYLVPLVVLFAPTRTALRRFGIQGSLALAGVTLCYLVVPAVSPSRPHTATGWLGAMLDLERATSVPPVAALPSFHVIWACLAAELVAGRSKGAAVAAWGWALAVAVSCVTTGMHAIVDIVAALGTYGLLRHYEDVYRLLLRGTERMANSWREWRFGPVRVINHGLYAGAAGFVGVGVMGWLSGHTGWTFLIAASGLVGAAVWAQTVEGSPSLLRPFGYYGFLIGSLAAVAGCVAAGGPAMELFAAGAVAAPWVQALGRLRCLVQGCCHGKPVTERFGIKVIEVHSRVTKLGHLKGVSIHPTQLYSILGNLVIGLVLARMWMVGAPLGVIAGLYLVLSGLARFVEETYRGEPQTLTYGGLAIYHWLAVACVVVGAVIMGAPAGRPAGSLEWPEAGTVAAALAGFGMFFVAMGVDLPESRVRFTRLSG